MALFVSTRDVDLQSSLNAQQTALSLCRTGWQAAQEAIPRVMLALLLQDAGSGQRAKEPVAILEVALLIPVLAPGSALALQEQEAARTKHALLLAHPTSPRDGWRPLSLALAQALAARRYSGAEQHALAAFPDGRWAVKGSPTLRMEYLPLHQAVSSPVQPHASWPSFCPSCCSGQARVGFLRLAGAAEAHGTAGRGRR